MLLSLKKFTFAKDMKIELRKISGEEVPALIFGCERCRHEFELRMDEVKTTNPYLCGGCDTPRFITYREYLDLQEKYAATLLDFTIARIASGS
jgi:hypothetical protein